MAGIFYSPFVYWSQTESEISLRVELRDVQNPTVDVEPHQLMFCAVAVGAQGEKNYEFSLQFYGQIDTEASKYRILDRYIEFSLAKVHKEFWPRLLEDAKKPAWLKVDFDKWCHEEDLEDEAKDIMDEYPDLFDNMRAQELGWPEKRQSLKQVYLFLYNLCQLVFFTYVLSVMLISYMRDGSDFLVNIFIKMGWMMRWCLLLQILEVFHRLSGLTQGSSFETIVQCSGRATIFFCLVQSELHMQQKPEVFCMFTIWSLIELIRYPFYMLRVIEVEVSILSWLRYTAWMILYPLGFFCEASVIFSAIPYFEDSGRFSLSMPNSLNWTFHFPSVLRIYLLFFFFPVMYKMMTYMYQQRRKKLRRHYKTD